MSILAIENALITEIKTVLGFPAAPKVRTVESLPADWDEETLRRLLRAVPGVFVVFKGGRIPPGGAVGRIPGEWSVIVVTGHASGEAARRRGDSQQVGAYELIETLIPKLHGLKITNEGSFDFIGVENLYTGAIDKQGVAVYAIGLQMPMAWPNNLNLSLLNGFVTFDAQYDIPPHETAAEHAKWLQEPPDYGTTKPNTEDKITIPQ